MKCYEIKNCPFKGTDHSTSKCPPHKLKVGCWEYDWVSYYNKMPECNEKLEWREVMLKRCTNCKVYKLHREDMNVILEALKNSK
ncbi:hypothetical protein GOQ27_03420 [Clostridium sp. D2Q-11]|uniref:Uncharacterized protein n=1 Tax=Anaeromonas frigoriresistens TaxID=2683708 RepID=A0A942UT54_9FIRM|nr:hypothetical protein [Anaeromonas frigoriresistens]MBS4537495.1 hypothetical protein [Anaeromonas frigoriresistens]